MRQLLVYVISSTVLDCTCVCLLNVLEYLLDTAAMGLGAVGHGVCDVILYTTLCTFLSITSLTFQHDHVRVRVGRGV